MVRYFLIALFSTLAILKTQAQRQNLTIGIDYEIHQHNPQATKIQVGNFVKFHLEMRNYKDSIIKTTYPNNPIIKEISELYTPENYQFTDRGFLQDMLSLLSEKDSVSFYINSDIAFSTFKSNRPAFIPAGSEVKYNIKVLQVIDRYNISTIEKQYATQQNKSDEAIIIDYIKKNNLKASRTSSGLWFIVHEAGIGTLPAEGDVVRINYVGKFLDGKVFGSSELNKEPLEFPIKQGIAIKGLDEGIAAIKEGSKATFIIPASLGYGEKGVEGLIPPNTILLFEVEFLSIVAKNIGIEKSILRPGEVEEKTNTQQNTQQQQNNTNNNKNKTLTEEERKKLEQQTEDVKKKGFFGDDNKKKDDKKL